MKRREFLKTTLAGAALAAGAGAFPSRLIGAVPPNPELLPGQERIWPRLRVRGSHRAVGEAIGGAFGAETKAALKARARWFKPLVEFSTSRDGRPIVDKMLAMARQHAGPALEELEGWAAAAGMESRELFILNCKSEIEAFIDSRCGCAGCTTAAFVDEDRLLVWHNEDGHKAYQGKMFVLDAEVPGVPRVLGLVYPGIMAGNAPWVNSAGIVMTTNYIPSATVHAGIPRYFTDRMAMEATSAEDAIAVVCHRERAYAFHHIVADLKTRRAWTVEGNPDKIVQREVQGLVLHTNHLRWEGMKDEPQFEEYIAKSSMPRLRSVTADLEASPAPSRSDVVKAFTSHQGAPWSVCRHPGGEATGATLGAALFEAKRGDPRPLAVEYWKGQPCLGNVATYTVG
ncbi:MAG: C45 family peptidase [Pseudomonadota bacterium]